MASPLSVRRSIHDFRLDPNCSHKHVTKDGYLQNKQVVLQDQQATEVHKPAPRSVTNTSTIRRSNLPANEPKLIVKVYEPVEVEKIIIKSEPPVDEHSWFVTE